jgi:hypothetical protein
MSYKYASPPLISSDNRYKSLQINNLLQSHSPALSWNDTYNNGDVLELGVVNNYIIDYQKQPFNYIEVTSSADLSSTKPLEIRNIPQTWITVNNKSNFDVTISPQVDGGSFDSSNNYTLLFLKKYLLSIKPNPKSVQTIDSFNENNVDLITVSGIILN